MPSSPGIVWLGAILIAAPLSAQELPTEPTPEAALDFEPQLMLQDIPEIPAIEVATEPEAQEAVEMSKAISQENSEIYVMEALIQVAWIVYDPATNGMKLSGKVAQLYNKALALDPTNPRAVFGKAEFEMGGAKYFGQDTKPMCAQVERAVALFAEDKPETPFHPSWGLDRAQQTLNECKK